jgi:methyltransferase-like protein
LPFVREPGERPNVSPLARRQAADGANWVTNLRHEAVAINNVDRLLLPYLDGTRDRAALMDVVADLARSGDYVVKQQGQPVTDPDQVRTLAAPVVADRLTLLGSNALFVE